MPDDTNTATPLVDEAALRKGVADLTYFRGVRCIGSVESTNALALSMLDDASSPGLTITAKNLEAGRKAMAERNYRRLGLGASLIAIAVILVGLRLYLKRIEA